MHLNHFSLLSHIDFTIPGKKKKFFVAERDKCFLNKMMIFSRAASNVCDHSKMRGISFTLRISYAMKWKDDVSDSARAHTHTPSFDVL